MMLLLAPLVACVTESDAVSATKQAQSAALLTQKRAIDWSRANEDASQSGARSIKRAGDTALSVPLLLPPTTVDISAAPGKITFVEPKILSDAKGYSAVVASSDFDMLIDASNQMILTDDVTTADYPQDFDGEYRSIEMGSQLTIGRYGALYAIQFICTNSVRRFCIDEQTAREIVQSLQVQLP